mgnify:FL=1
MSRALFTALDRKLVRDLWRMRGQALAIAAVIAAGVAVHLIMAGMLASLSETRQAYYERYRFSDLWAPVVRAPEGLREEIRAIPGVAAAETRIRAPALFDMPGMAAPPAGAILSLPSGRAPTVNALHVERGRLPDPARRDEAAVLKSYAEAHGLEVGDTLDVTIRGKRERLVITGFVLSPEFVYAIAPGQLVPDPQLFGVVWMTRDALETAADLEGAFNEAVVRLVRGADPAAVQDALDRLLAPYGATGAYPRRDHVSDGFLQSEIDQLQTMGDVLPPVFLAVAAFLVNIVISRLIAVEREQIGLLKAFGYGSGEIAAHYLKLVGLIAVIGLALGFGLGTWLGREMAALYTQYYDFPFLIFAATPAVYAIGVAVALIAVGAGAALSVTRAARLAPAVAMRPAPPPDYSRAFGSGLTRLQALDQQTRMILRQLTRAPVRAGLTVLGIAMAATTLVTSLYFTDAVDEMVASYFSTSNRHDLAVSFVEPRSMAAFHDLARRDGVLEAEPVRRAPARLSFEHREVRSALTGAPADAKLSRMITQDGRTVIPPPGGLALSDDLAGRLGAAVGDTLEVQVTEGERPALSLRITSTPVVLVGSGAHMRLEDLNAALGEDRVISGVNLRVDPERRDALYEDLKAAPAVAGVALHAQARENFVELIDQSMGSTIAVYTIFAAVLALGVIYNAMRVSLAERERELASLRVLGFSKGDVGYILLGEAAFLVLAAIPLGLAMGAGMAWAMSKAMSSDFFRLPYVITLHNLGYSALVLIVIAAASGLILARRIARLDLVAVLKTRE